MNEMKPNDNPLNNPLAAILPTLFANIAPAPLMKMGAEDGIIKKAFINIHSRQMTEYMRNIAEISGYQRTASDNQMAMIESVVTFSARIQNQFANFEAEKELIEVRKMYAQQELMEKSLKNQLLQTQLEHEKLDFELKQKEAGIGSDKAKDRL